MGRMGPMGPMRPMGAHGAFGLEKSHGPHGETGHETSEKNPFRGASTGDPKLSMGSMGPMILPLGAHGAHDTATGMSVSGGKRLI